MNDFKESLKVDIDKEKMKRIIEEERKKTALNKEISLKQAKERMIVYDSLLEKLNTPDEVLKRRSEEAWFK